MHYALAWQKVVSILEHWFFYASMKTQSADRVPGVTEHITMQWRYNVVDSRINSDTGSCWKQMSVWSKKLPIMFDKNVTIIIYNHQNFITLNSIEYGTYMDCKLLLYQKGSFWYMYTEHFTNVSIQFVDGFQAAL